MIDVFTTIWRFRWIVLGVFVFLAVLDLVLGAFRLIVIEVLIFIFGVVIGRMRSPPPGPATTGSAPGGKPDNAIMTCYSAVRKSR